MTRENNDGGNNAYATHAPRVRTNGGATPRNPLGEDEMRDNRASRPTSSVHFNENHLTNKSACSLRSTPPPHPGRDQERDGAGRGQCFIGTIVAVALIMFAEGVAISATNLITAQYVGTYAVTGIARVIEAEAVRSVTTIMRSTVLQLPDFAHIVNAEFMRNQTSLHTVDTFPRDPKVLLLSLASLLSTFRDTITYVKFIYEGGSYAFAVNYGFGVKRNESVVFGAYSNSPCSAQFAAYNASNLHILTPTTAMTWNISHDLKSASGPFETLARTWRNNASKNRWFPDGINEAGEYFNYVTPFDVGGHLGACIVGLSTDRLLLESRPLVEALRAHGRVLLFDDVRDVVVLNSWGQLVVQEQNSSERGPMFRHLTVDDISDPLVSTFVRHIATLREPITNRMNDSAEVSFPVNESFVDGRISRITDDSDLSVVLGVLTLRSDFFAGIAKARETTLFYMSVIMLLSALASLASTCYLVKPLTRVVKALKSASNLEIYTGGEITLGRTRITEVRKIQVHYLKLRRQLAVLLKFVPEAILANVERRGGIRPPNLSHGLASGTPEESSTVLPRTLGESTSAAWRSGDQKRDLGIDCGIFTEKPNVFNRKHCTVVAIQIDHPGAWMDSMEHYGTLIGVATEHFGCIEALETDRVLVSFGAHATLPMHCRKCCQFAFALLAKLPPSCQESITMLVDTNEFLVGTCGAASRNARVVFGTEQLYRLCQAAKHSSCRIAATNGCASHLQGFRALPIDCVLLTGHACPVVLSELRPGDNLHGDANDTTKQFRVGFAAMRRGSYGEAAAQYKSMAKVDKQARRLLRECLRRCQCGDVDPYIRADDDHLSADRGGYRDEEREENDNGDDVPPVVTLSKQLAKRGSTGNSSEGGSESLFKMFALSSSSSSECAGCAEGVNAADIVPLLLSDSNEKAWTRSLQKISEGAFSTIFLGVADDGAQVAIKCIPRLRRDIASESLEKEMEMASKLNHPNIVRYVSCGILPSHLFIFMEYIPGGSLHSIIKSFGRVSLCAARRFTVDILQGLNYLHNLGIVHCDVKPHNVLLDTDGVCKLSDFGSAISEAADMARTTVDEELLRGTAVYMSPEVAAGGRCTFQSDIFSLGISLMEMLAGHLPWRWSASAPPGSDATRLRNVLSRDLHFVQSLARGHLEPVVPSDVDTEAAAFVRACCHPNPAMRPSASSLLSYSFLL